MIKPPIFNKQVWRSIFAGPLRIVLLVEREDGTELYRMFPLGSEAGVYAGQTVSLDFEVGLHIDGMPSADPEKSAGQRAYEEWSKGRSYDSWDDLAHDSRARWERVAHA